MRKWLSPPVLWGKLGDVAAESDSNDRLPTRLAAADRPGLSANGSGTGPVVRAAGDSSEFDFLLLDRGGGGSELVLLAGGCRALVADRGRGVLLFAAMAEHAGWHGGAGLGHGQPRRRNRQRAAGSRLRR